MLTWLPRNSAPKLYTRAAAARLRGGGIYIVVELNSTGGVKRILKAGKTGNFGYRFGKNDTYKKPLKLPKDKDEEPVAPTKLRFYVGRYRGIDRMAHMERAIIRLMARAGQTLPAGRHVPRSPVSARVRISNVLPKPLMAHLGRAYRAAGGDPQRTASLASDNLLLLSPSDYAGGWELSQPTKDLLGEAELDDELGMEHGGRCRCPRCVAVRQRGRPSVGKALSGSWERRGKGLVVVGA